MRLLRWGAPGAEKPGLVDDEGIERDLSPWLQDLDASALEPAVLAQLSARSPSGCRGSHPTGASAPAYRTAARSSASA